MAVAAYHNALTTPFLFDDSIAETPALHRFWSLRPLLGTTRPLVQFSLALNYAIGGLDVGGYHVFNLTIHVLAALTLFGIVARTLRTPRLAARWSRSASSSALAVSLIWTVHPLQAESVTYVAQRAESLMALFYLLTLYCVIRGAASSRPWRWYAACAVACALGMLSKPVMVTAPIMVLLYDRTFLAGSWGQAWRERRTLYAGLAATWILLALLLTGHHESAATAGFAMRDLTALDYLRSQPQVILHYLRLAFWPRGLVLDYAWPVADNIRTVALPALILTVLGVLTIWIFHRQPEVGVLGLMFFLVLAPTSSVIPIKDLAVEHRMYLPLAPLAALTVVCGRLLIQGAALKARVERSVLIGLTAAVVATLTMLTVARNRDYRSAISMWTDVIVKRPENARAHNNLGSALVEDGKLEEALPQLRMALQLDPAYADAHNNLGRALAARRNYKEAESHYAEALRLNPNFAEAQNNFGVALAAQGRFEEAMAHYADALHLKPEYADAQNNVGVALAAQGRFEEAMPRYAEALRLKPEYAEAYSNIGNAFALQGKLADAVQRYVEALRINPSYAEVHYNLALALAAQGKRDEAAAHIAEASRLRPDLREVYRKSGLSQAQ